jgi:hypothetical protein
MQIVFKKKANKKSAIMPPNLLINNSSRWSKPNGSKRGLNISKVSISALFFPVLIFPISVFLVF